MIMKRTNVKSKDCYASICQALKRKGHECDLIDIRALTDSKLSCHENKKNVLKQVKVSVGDDYGRYAGQYEDFARSYGKCKVKKLCNPPIKVKGHCKKKCTIKVKPYKRSCPTKIYR